MMADDYFMDIVEFLNTGVTPYNMIVSQKKQFVVKATNYHLITVNLYKLGADGILRWCVLEKKSWLY